MKFFTRLITFLFACMPLCVVAQKKSQLQAMRIFFDDDFFNYRGEGTDREYTAGTKIDFYYTNEGKRNFFDKLLIRMASDADNLYGYGITQQMYAPNNIDTPGIVIGDRPYAGVLTINHSLVSSDMKRGQKITTQLDIGVIGPWAFAEQTQNFAHNLIGYREAQGWDNQIANDIIINYYILYEKLLINPSPNLQIIGLLESNIGTRYNNLAVGLTFRAGIYNSYFCNYEKPSVGQRASRTCSDFRKFQVYVFMRPVVRAVMDDATLQGGFFTHENSPYYLTKDQITRVHMQYDWGLVIARGRLGLSFSEKLRTKEFDTGVNHQIGNLTLYVGL
ncbi:hypothetical protein LX64_01952 [Chitinophaga skermanii]|uniref:Lipid A deacylase LpxR family protein n=1 Tax=Chitinophaga skermanii TaxID=331697 RepID=A0A327QSF4_9BACT|nr:lipid A deacylase LpxR family protein [Chitinophaga skermanii]RAJ06825.1 hypothetical protein LX64_01952 [Chitinophaga skermanii]